MRVLKSCLNDELHRSPQGGAYGNGDGGTTALAHRYSSGQTTHSLAADAVNNTIYVPVTAVGVEVWSNGPLPLSFTANPNPIVVTGGATVGATTLSWTAPGVGVVEVHIGSPNGPLFTQQGGNGSAQTGNWVSDGMTFYPQDVTGGKPLVAANTLATVVVHLKSM